MEAGGYRSEVTRARANGRMSGLRRDLLLQGRGEGGNKVLSPQEDGKGVKYGKEKAINFYDRKLSLAWAR